MYTLKEYARSLSQYQNIDWFDVSETLIFIVATFGCFYLKGVTKNRYKIITKNDVSGKWSYTVFINTTCPSKFYDLLQNTYMKSM